MVWALGSGGEGLLKSGWIYKGGRAVGCASIVVKDQGNEPPTRSTRLFLRARVVFIE